MTRFVAFVSGKGGVGKTTTALNVAHALHRAGKQVILVDANIATPNVGLQLGLIQPDGTLNRFLRKEKGLHEIIYRHDSGVTIVPSSLSLDEFQNTDPKKMTEIFEHLDNIANFVLVDAPSGLGVEVNEILKNTDEVLIVANPTLSSVMDALKTIQLAQEHNNTIAGVILNMSNYGWSELKPEEVQKILGHPIIANIRHDRKFRKALLKQSPLGSLYPRSRSATEFKRVANHLCIGEELLKK
jgi:septum site-determining protein MinD